MKAIGQRLALTRHVLGLQQSGKKRPTIDNAIRLAEAYHLTLDWIYLGDPSGLRYETANAISAARAARSNYGST